MTVQKIAAVGAGTMGTGKAQVAARTRVRVILSDRKSGRGVSQYR